MIELKQTETFRKWLAKLRGERTVTAIVSRLARLAFGHAGDKGSQARDIETALRLAKEWNE